MKGIPQGRYTKEFREEAVMVPVILPQKDDPTLGISRNPKVWSREGVSRLALLEPVGTEL